MNATTAYLIVAILGLLLVAAAFFIVRRQGRQNRLSPAAGLAFALVIASALFSDIRLIAYGLIGAGILIAVYDIIRQRRTRTP